MNWLGSGEHFGLLYALAWYGLATALQRWIEGPHLVPHRKLRAAAEARRKPATGSHAPCNAPVAGPQLRAAAGRLRTDEPAAARREPAPDLLASGAGNQLQATTEAWIEELRCDNTPAQSSTPAPGRASGAPGAGPEPRSVADVLPSRVDGGSGQRILYVFHSFPAPKQPVDDRDRALQPSTGPQMSASASAHPPDLALAGSTDSGAGVPRTPAPDRSAA